MTTHFLGRHIFDYTLSMLKLKIVTLIAQIEDMNLFHCIDAMQLITLSPSEVSQFLASRAVPLVVLPAIRR